jgi:hypothetical protein
MYEGAAIHTGGEFAVRARVWNIGAAEAQHVWATLRDIPLDPKTEKPYFEVVQTVKDPPQEIALSAGLSPLKYQDVGMEEWIPGSSETFLTGNDTYNDNYSSYGYEKYLGEINMNEYKTVEFTLKPTETWMEVEQSCNEVKLTGLTIMARREGGYPQSSGAMIDDGDENENILSGHDRKSSIAKWISDWSTSGVDCADGIQCNEAACGNSFVSLQGTPMYYYKNGSPMIDPGWYHLERRHALSFRNPRVLICLMTLLFMSIQDRKTPMVAIWDWKSGLVLSVAADLELPQLFLGLTCRSSRSTSRTSVRM